MYYVLVLALTQVPFSSISGRVIDSSGGALAGATVTATCPAQAAVTVQTDATGTYRFEKLPLARCRVGASLDGFATVERVADLTATTGPLVFRLAVQRSRSRSS